VGQHLRRLKSSVEGNPVILEGDFDTRSAETDTADARVCSVGTRRVELLRGLTVVAVTQAGDFSSDGSRRDTRNDQAETPLISGPPSSCMCKEAAFEDARSSIRCCRIATNARIRWR
jgi:hypothetical protein